MKKSLTIVAAALALVACSQVSEKTSLTGIVPADYTDDIHVKAADVDTIVYAENGKFSLEVPRDVMSISYVQLISGGVGFISDGTRITIDFTQDEPTVVSSAKKECAAYVDYIKATSDFVQNYQSMMQEVSADNAIAEESKESVMESRYNELWDAFKETSKEVVKANKDNANALVALNNIYNDVEGGELMDLIGGLAPELQEDNFVKTISMAAQAQASTAEGKMFTDFEVEYDGNTTKFSDYIGKGKYMLVDFWASWCGPCKAEIPNIKEVYAKHHGDQFDILSVAVWDEPQASIDTAAVYEIPWNHMVNAQKIPTDIYGIEGIPHIILFGPDGTILKRNLRGDNIEKTVSEYVK